LLEEVLALMMLEVVEEPEGLEQAMVQLQEEVLLLNHH
jgi:hypothetical protein